MKRKSAGFLAAEMGDQADAMDASVNSESEPDGLIIDDAGTMEPAQVSFDTRAGEPRIEEDVR
jgi:hypothetical protein